MNCPICGQQMIGVEYGLTHPDHFDGVSEWLCNNHALPYRLGRFTGRELRDAESEPRYGVCRRCHHSPKHCHCGKAGE